MTPRRSTATPHNLTQKGSTMNTSLPALARNLGPVVLFAGTVILAALHQGADATILLIAGGFLSVLNVMFDACTEPPTVVSHGAQVDQLQRDVDETKAILTRMEAKADVAYRERTGASSGANA